MASLELHHVFKVYPNGVKAVNDFVLEAPDKEFIVFVGPSGCGKSTTLRMIAGLEDITAGDIKIDGQIVNDSEPKERDIAMVFQNYALYPHMTVYKNMQFGLKLRHVPKDEIDRRVREAAEILGLTEYLNRKPKEMSGGQRQRVALGRAIVREPKLFLLDEPLSNLDAKLRASMRSEISKLHKKLGTTFVYVTHDQVEAMTLGTKVVVMKQGFVQQIDSPINLYKYPTNKFVAGFIGTPQMNFFEGTLEKQKDIVLMKINDTDLSFKLPMSYFAKTDLKYLDGKKELTFGIRSEHISVDGKKFPYKARVKVNFMEELGVDSQIYASFNLENNEVISDDNEQQLIIKCSNTTHYETNDIIDVYFDLNQLHVFDKETEKSINPRIPEQMSTTAKIDKKSINIFNTKITLPNAILALPGEYDVTIPTSAIKLGTEVEANIISVESIQNEFLYVLEKDGLYFCMIYDSKIGGKVGDKVNVDIDFKQCKFTNNDTTIEPLQTHTTFSANVIKIPTKVQHFDKNDKEYYKKEYYCSVEINGISYGTNSNIGMKLLNLKEKKIFKGEIDAQISCYNMKLGSEGIPANVIGILDYGKEKFAQVEILIPGKEENNKQNVIVACDDKTVLGETCLSLDVNRAKFYNKKNGVRLA